MEWIVIPVLDEPVPSWVKKVEFPLAVAFTDIGKGNRESWQFVADIFIEVEERGKGIALRKLFREVEGDVLVVDADETYPLDKAGEFFSLLKKWDAVWGVRDRSLLPFWKRAGNWFCSFLSSIFYSPISDVCTGMYSLREEVKDIITPCLSAKGFEIEVDIYSELIFHGFRVKELKIPYYPRDHSNISYFDGIKILSFLTGKWLRRVLGCKEREYE